MAIPLKLTGPLDVDALASALTHVGLQLALCAIAYAHGLLASVLRLFGLLPYVLVLVVASRQEVHRLYDEMGKTSPFDNRLKLIRVGLSRDDAAANARHVVEPRAGYII